MKKAFGIFLLTVLLGAVICAGCGEGNPDAPAASGGKKEAGDSVIMVADTQCPTSLDPAQSWDSWYTSRWGITETLYMLDENLNPYPFLAESCEMLDETTWVITLRDDVTFQNGKPLTAESVKACWERTAEINARFDEILYIDRMEAEGQTLIVETTQPVPAFRNGLCEPLTGIIDVDSGTDPAAAPVGTGPFLAVSYEKNLRCQVKKYENYWGGEPEADGAVIYIIADTATMTLAQQNGEIDISVSMPGSSLKLFADSSRYRVDDVPGSRGQILYFNYENEILQQSAVRQAVSRLIDKESYASVINRNASVSTRGLYPDFMAYGASEKEGYAYGPEEAARILDAAGIVDVDGDGIREWNGEDLSLRLVTYSTKAELPLFGNELSASAEKIGLDIQTEVYESVTEQQKTGDFDLMLVSMTMCPTGDPQYFADIALKTGGSGNYGGYSNTRVDALIERLDAEFDGERRTELAREIQEEVLADAGIIVIGHAKYYYIMGTDVQGLHTNPSEYYLLSRDISVD